jgi:hypothetical protein
MHSTVAAIAILAGVFVSLLLGFLPLLLMSTKQWKAVEERAHARRLADASMNARLLRLNL